MSYTGRYPASRPRRLRQSDWIRRLTREHRLGVDDLIWALVVHGGGEPEIPVTAMPGAPRLSVSAAAKAAKRRSDGQTDACVARCRLDDGTSGFKPPLLHRIIDDRPPYAVFYRSPGIEVLKFCQNQGLKPTGDGIQTNKRCMTDRGQDVFVILQVSDPRLLSYILVRNHDGLSLLSQ